MLLHSKDQITWIIEMKVQNIQLLQVAQIDTSPKEK